ncbi:uncharacterized protein LOC131637576 [Vicia villosa]|uniref:uncharacterized protein LOC131637576 n=1 Tax=Vicia villosa TaxID=3911 RepID=UPI00273C42FF|nr:uncharacterized protein LOC131637576 [Vicia villosa]
MAPRYIVSALKDKDPENLTSITQIYKARATYKLGKRGALTEVQMLFSLIHQEKYMCWSRNKENSDIVADIFWKHPDSVKLLNMFPLYRLPLLEIVGVTSTQLTFSVAFAYLEHERDENFTWALERLNELFYCEKFLPDVMVMDRMKFKEYVKLERQEHAMDQWNNMMYSNTKDEFDVHLNHFESGGVCTLETAEHVDNKSSFISRHCIQIIGKKLEKGKFVGASKQRCGCYIRTTCGLSCACHLVGYQILGIPIPLESIHVFWTKLQIYEYEVSLDEEKWDLEEECEELKRQFSTMDIVGQRALKKKVCDIAYPSTSSMCPPPVKYKPKRGIKKSRKGEESDVHRDPS